MVFDGSFRISGDRYTREEIRLMAGIVVSAVLEPCRSSLAELRRELTEIQDEYYKMRFGGVGV